MKYSRATVRVPATTANLGPAFDSVGMALDIWNQVDMEIGTNPKVLIEGEGFHILPTDTYNLVYRSAVSLFLSLGITPPPLHIRCQNRVPLERGLGSSAAAIVGGLVAANKLTGDPLSQAQLLSLATELEGHPDNVAAALLGGIQIVVEEGGQIQTSPVKIPPNLKSIVYVPQDTVSTSEARAILPRTVNYEDAIFNIGRVAMLINALAGNRLEDLLTGTADRIHQPYRHNLFPGMQIIIRAAVNGGALGAFVSGSGPTVVAFTNGKELTIAYEMAEAARKANVEGDIKITSPTSNGTHILETPNEELS